MDLELTAPIWFWKGPSPHHFVTVPEDLSADLEAVSSSVTYGWGMIPVRARIGDTLWRTSLYPKDGGYIVPIKADVRRAEGIDVGDVVSVRLSIAT